MLKLGAFDLYLCAVQILERRVPPVLDVATISQFPARCTGRHPIVILFYSILHLVRDLPVQRTSTANNFPVRVPVSRTPRYSRLRFHIHPTVRIAHTNNSPVRRFAAVYLLVGGTAAG